MYRSVRGLQRKLSHAPSNPRRNSDFLGATAAQHKHGGARPGGSALLDTGARLLAALWRWLGEHVALRHVLLALALLAILYLQVCAGLLANLDHAPWMNRAVRHAGGRRVPVLRGSPCFRLVHHFQGWPDLPKDGQNGLLY